MGTRLHVSRAVRGAGRSRCTDGCHALGCVLYELLSGRTPFGGWTGTTDRMHPVSEPPPLRSVAPQVPSEIAELVHRMLRKEKTQRPTMREAGRAGKPTGETDGNADRSSSTVSDRCRPRRNQGCTARFTGQYDRSLDRSAEQSQPAQGLGLCFGTAALLVMEWSLWRGCFRPAPKSTATSSATSSSLSETPKQTPPCPIWDRDRRRLWKPQPK